MLQLRSARPTSRCKAKVKPLPGRGEVWDASIFCVLALSLNGLILGDAFLKSDLAKSSNHPSETVNVPKSPSPPTCKRERAKAVLVAGTACVLALSHWWQVAVGDAP